MLVVRNGSAYLREPGQGFTQDVKNAEKFSTVTDVLLRFQSCNHATAGDCWEIEEVKPVWNVVRTVS